MTHRLQEEQIKKIPGKYCFTTRRKVGKSLDDRDREKGCYRGESFQRFERGDSVIPNESTFYERIPANREVIPGFYTWWGLYTENPPPGPQDTLPNYLKSPPNSIYGSRAFVVSFHEMLESYAFARSRHPGQILFRVGGTMRYKHEIAYVVIVCTASDADPIKKHDELIHLKALIDDKGVNRTCAPLFTAKYYNTYNSYETLNFAFYFPEQCDFECSSGVICVKTIEHTGCIRKSQLKYLDRKTSKVNSYEICPNKIEERHRYAHQKATEFES